MTPGTGATTGGTRIALQGKRHALDGRRPRSPSPASRAPPSRSRTPPISRALTPGQRRRLRRRHGDATPTASVDRGRRRLRLQRLARRLPRGPLRRRALRHAHRARVRRVDGHRRSRAAQAIAGSSLATALTGTFDANGAAQLTGPSLNGTVTVTVAAHCHQPMTYVDVPVDTVTVYLNPTLDPACAQGDPRRRATTSRSDGGEIDGELVWSGGIEFQRRPGATSPRRPRQPSARPRTSSRATGNPTAEFYLPTAVDGARRRQSDGQLGYQYALGRVPRATTTRLRAGRPRGRLDAARRPSSRSRWASRRGVPVQPGTKTTGVDIPMTTLLNRTLTTVPQPPPPAPRRARIGCSSSVAIALGAGWLRRLARRARAPACCPSSGDLSFVGVPALDDTLAGSTYELSGAAVTGTQRTDPVSVVAGIQTTDANDPVTIGGFFADPHARQAAALGRGAARTCSCRPAGPSISPSSPSRPAAGWSTGRSSRPAPTCRSTCPTSRRCPGVDSLVHGAISTTFDIARITGFDYGTLRSTGSSTSSPGTPMPRTSRTGSY